ncbi:MAG: hypothetical protein LC753_08545, partial [Acidobacteria bacterium]|nr:hypothetical protein [Acidobacteriota bacterium]
MRQWGLSAGLIGGVCAAAIGMSAQAPASAPAERHLANIRQLTSGGENAEAYFSPDGSRLIYQSTVPEYPCDQIYTINVDGSARARASNGTGRTTCGYFYPGGRH